MPSSKGAKKATFYAVRKGRIPGIYTTWEECQEQTHGVSGSIHAKFSSAAEAEDFIYGKGSSKDITSARATTQRSYTSANAPKEMDKKQVNISDIEDESSWDVVYTDGACKGNGKVGCIAGIGVWWGPSDPRNIAERCPGDQTNNRAELVAIVRALETTPISKRPLLIKSDSKYSINCFGVWLKNWEKNNFRTSTGLDVKNRNIILYLSALLRLRGRSGQKLHLQYVKGHSGDEGNDGADMLANQGTILPEEKDRDWAKLLRDLEKDTDNKLGEDNINQAVGLVQKPVALPPKVENISPTVAVAIVPSHSDNSADNSRKRKLCSPDPTSPARTAKSRRAKMADGGQSPTATAAKPSSSPSTPSSRYPTATSLYNPSSPSISAKPPRSPTITGGTVQTVTGMSAAALTLGPTTKSLSSSNRPYTTTTVSTSEINFEDYADGVLSDEDLAKELDS